MYQFIKHLILPPTLTLLLLTLLVIMMWWKKAIRRRWLICLVAVIVLFYAGSARIVTRLFIGSLEWPYSRQQSLPDHADAILVLGGGNRYYGPDSKPTYKLSDSSTDRVLHAAEIYHKIKGCPIIVSGNDCYSRNEPTPPNSDDRLKFNTMSRLLLDLGVKPEDIILEEASRNTYENVSFAKKIIEEKGLKDIVLVTDASHMWRSELCCQKQGLQVTPAACNYYAQALEFSPRTILPTDLGVIQARKAAREYLGLFWYWLNGRL